MIRSRGFIDNDDNQWVDIPPEFWRTVGKKDFYEVCQTNELTQNQIKRLWHLTANFDEPLPRRVVIKIQIPIEAH